MLAATTYPHVQRISNQAAAAFPPSTKYLERVALLEKYGYPGRSRWPSKEKLPALYRFLNGQEAITRQDSLEISNSLSARLDRQDVKLLHAMQKLDPDFVPFLMFYGDFCARPENYWGDPRERKLFDLKLERTADELCAVLGEAARSGLTFNVNVVGARPMAMRVALALQEIMRSPQCKIKGFQFSPYANIHELLETPTGDVLRQCIADCSTLEWVCSDPSAVGLVSRGVPILEIKAITGSISSRALEEILKRGGTAALHLTSWKLEPHVTLAKAIRQGNSSLPADLGVRSVKLHDEGGMEPSEWALDARRQCMDDLFSTPHLTQLEIPNVAWLASLDPERAAALIQHSSLQNLTFERDDVVSPEGEQVLDHLWPHLKANRDLAYLPLQRAAAVWSGHLMGQQIDHLANIVAEKLAPSPVDRSIFTNQRKDMRDAAATKSDRERAIEAKRKEI